MLEKSSQSRDTIQLVDRTHWTKVVTYAPRLSTATDLHIGTFRVGVGVRSVGISIFKETIHFIDSRKITSRVNLRAMRVLCVFAGLILGEALGLVLA